MQADSLKKAQIPSILASALLLMGGLHAHAAETVEVNVEARQGFKFEPSTLEVPAGTEVVVQFKNAGAMAHNVQFPEFDAGTETIGSGKSETFRFTAGESGTYEYLCDVPGHAQAGMTGEITVR